MLKAMKDRHRDLAKTPLFLSMLIAVYPKGKEEEFLEILEKEIKNQLSSKADVL